MAPGLVAAEGDHSVVPSRRRRLLERWLEARLGSGFLATLRSRCLARGPFGTDPFGYDPDEMAWSLPMAHFLYRSYFRVETFGIERVPPGPLLLVANHSGQIPVDGMMIAGAMLFDAPEPRMLRSMIERWVPTLPFVSYWLARCGQVLGTPENCRLLLRQHETILVFPEGSRGISKTYQHAYQLQDFGSGFMRLALEGDVPIVPVAVIGAEEQAPSFHNARSIARLLGAPAFPLTPTFPWLPVLGLLPYPVKYRIHFGEPMTFTGDPDDEDGVIQDKVAQVKAAVAALIDRGLQERQHVFW